MSEKGRRRTFRIGLWLFEEENAMLAKNSFELGITKSDYLRKLILAGHIIGQHPILSKEQGRQLLEEVGKMGNNISNIAYNSSESFEATEEDWKAIRLESENILSLLGSLAIMEKEDIEEWQQQVSTQSARQ